MSRETSKPTREPEFESVRILRLEPGDEIILTLTNELDYPEVIRKAEERWPNHRVTVLAKGIDIAVVRS